MLNLTADKKSTERVLRRARRYARRGGRARFFHDSKITLAA